MASFSTPLRYPGGKARLGPWLAELLSFNGLDNATYIEPYAGGAGAAIYLLLNNKVKNIILNDIDTAIYSFWFSVLTHPSHLIRLIRKTEISIDEWCKQKEIYTNPARYNEVELGFATFFLNRTNRSGILSAGVIGGKAQGGKYKIDARFNKEELIRRVLKINEVADRIKIYNLDCVDFLNKNVSIKNSELLYYLDPPYYQKGSQLYKNHYSHAEHESISRIMRDFDKPWIITYDACESIKKIYNGVNFLEFSFHYSTGLMRPVASEVLFFNNLKLPSLPYMTRRHASNYAGFE